MDAATNVGHGEGSPDYGSVQVGGAFFKAQSFAVLCIVPTSALHVRYTLTLPYAQVDDIGALVGSPLPVTRAYDTA